jgi:hypothetical protein
VLLHFLTSIKRGAIVNIRPTIPVCVLAISATFCTAQLALGQFGNQSSVKTGLRRDDVVLKLGSIIGISKPKNSKVELKVQTASEKETFTLDWRTMVYKLTDRNVKIFKEQDKLDDMIADVN